MLLEGFKQGGGVALRTFKNDCSGWYVENGLKGHREKWKQSDSGYCCARDNGILDSVVASEVMRSGWAQKTHKSWWYWMRGWTQNVRNHRRFLVLCLSKWANCWYCLWDEFGFKCSSAVPVKFEIPVLFIPYHGKIFSIVYNF